MKRTVLVPLACVVLIAAVVISSAPVRGEAGVGATPGQFAGVNVERGGSTDLTVRIYNTDTSTVDIKYHLSTDDAYSSWVSFDDNDFTLTPDTHRDVKVTVSAPEDASGPVRFTLYVVGSVVGTGGAAVAPALKIPVSLNLTAPQGKGIDRGELAPYLLGMAAVVLIALLALFLLTKRRGKKGPKKK